MFAKVRLEWWYLCLVTMVLKLRPMIGYYDFRTRRQFHTHLRVWVLLIEDPIVTVKYRTALFLYLNLCPSVMLNSLSCPFVTISSLTNCISIIVNKCCLFVCLFVVCLFVVCCLMIFNATFNNISAISWRPVLVVEKAGVPG